MDAMLRHKLDFFISAALAVLIVVLFPKAAHMAATGSTLGGPPAIHIDLGIHPGAATTPRPTPHSTRSGGSSGGSSGDLPPPPPPPPPLNSTTTSTGSSGGSSASSGQSSSGSGSGGSSGSSGSSGGSSGSGSSGGSTQVAYQMMVDFYDYFDSSPPTNQIDYPKIHQTAGGAGTYKDPVTFASDSTEFPPGTIVYIPIFKRYFVMEDSCDECTQDWTGQGPDGGPQFRRLDGWAGGDASQSANAMTTCEDQLVQDSTEVDVNPPGNLTVSSHPLWDTKTKTCYKP